MNKTSALLPEGILKSDLEYPVWKSKNKIVSEAGNYGRLTFHKVTNRGWVIATLPISAARRGTGYADRTYAIEVSPKSSYDNTHQIVTVGKGPHIEATVEIYITTKRLKALQPFLDLYTKGLGDAGSIRDRISTRRAQTVLRRSGSRLGWF
jgi:hypothetical protein